jgi:hypothetical protein
MHEIINIMVKATDDRENEVQMLAIFPLALLA